MNKPEYVFNKYDLSETGCWLYRTANKLTGYGEIMINNKKYMAHRLSYEIKNGPIPQDLQIDHLCRVRRCINPDHLEAVTMRENLIRGMSFSGINFRKEKCKNGHFFNEENTIFSNNGNHRRCRVCAVERTKKWKKARMFDSKTRTYILLT